MNVMDDTLIEALELDCKVHGIYVMSSKSEVGLLMVLNFAFIKGKFNGSAFKLFGLQHGVFNDDGDVDC